MMNEDPRLRNIPPAKPVNNYAKQAIVVIHGIGEQIPMETLRAFVHAVWETDTSLTPPRSGSQANPQEVWSKPDDRAGSLELRRITTRETKKTSAFSNGVRSDFYELYWADLSAGSQWAHIQAWVAGLLLRNPFTRVPESVLLTWAVLWVVVVVVLVLLAAAALPRESDALLSILWQYPPFALISDWSPAFLAFIAGVLAYAANRVIVPYVGRIVRYTRAIPDNVTARLRIRERGLALLDQLHRAEYERIVIVGHSLGSILAYDLVSYFWAMRSPARTIRPGTPAFAALQEVEKAVAGLAKAHDDVHAITRFHLAQRKLCGELRKRVAPLANDPDARWLITDLVTLGSPLGHAEFLLAESRDDLDRRFVVREFPTNPPVREQLDPKNLTLAKAAQMPVDPDDPRLFSFPFTQDKRWQMHHAAPFAAVRWTNIHDPAHLIFFGDIVSSPAAPVFGSGVADIDLKEERGQSEGFSHTSYWSVPDPADPPAHIVLLRRALDLAGERGLI